MTVALAHIYSHPKHCTASAVLIVDRSRLSVFINYCHVLAKQDIKFISFPMPTHSVDEDTYYCCFPLCPSAKWGNGNDTGESLHQYADVLEQWILVMP